MTNEPTRPLPENPSDDPRLTPPVPPEPPVLPEPSKAHNLRPEPPEPHPNATFGEETGALGAEAGQRAGNTSGRDASGRKASSRDASSRDARGGPERELPRPGPRTGPIVWGALILVFCAYITQQVFGGDGLDAAGWITLAVIGVGVLLLAVGVAVLVRNRRLAKRPDSR